MKTLQSGKTKIFALGEVVEKLGKTCMSLSMKMKSSL